MASIFLLVSRFKHGKEGGVPQKEHPPDAGTKLEVENKG